MNKKLVFILIVAIFYLTLTGQNVALGVVVCYKQTGTEPPKYCQKGHSSTPAGWEIANYKLCNLARAQKVLLDCPPEENGDRIYPLGNPTPKKPPSPCDAPPAQTGQCQAMREAIGLFSNSAARNSYYSIILNTPGVVKAIKEAELKICGGKSSGSQRGGNSEGQNRTIGSSCAEYENGRKLKGYKTITSPSGQTVTSCVYEGNEE